MSEVVSVLHFWGYMCQGRWLESRGVLNRIWWYLMCICQSAGASACSARRGWVAGWELTAAVEAKHPGLCSLVTVGIARGAVWAAGITDRVQECAHAHSLILAYRSAGLALPWWCHRPPSNGSSTVFSLYQGLAIFANSIVGTQPHQLTYILSVAAFLRQWPCW